MPLVGKQQGKAPQNKMAKKEKRELDEADIAFKEKQRAEQKAMKEAAAKLHKK